MKPALIPLIGSAALLAACAQPMGPVASASAHGADASASAGGCFRAHDIRNHTVADDHTLYIDVGGRAVYRIAMHGACLAASTSSDPIITRQHGGSNLVCRPIDLDIGIDRSGFETKCIVESITKLAPAEVAALPPKLRP